MFLWSSLSISLFPCHTRDSFVLFYHFSVNYFHRWHEFFQRTSNLSHHFLAYHISLFSLDDFVALSCLISVMSHSLIIFSSSEHHSLENEDDDHWWSSESRRDSHAYMMSTHLDGICVFSLFSLQSGEEENLLFYLPLPALSVVKKRRAVQLLLLFFTLYGFLPAPLFFVPSKTPLSRMGKKDEEREIRPCTWVIRERKEDEDITGERKADDRYFLLYHCPSLYPLTFRAVLLDVVV